MHLYIVAFILGKVNRYLRPIFYLIFLLTALSSRNLTFLFIAGLLIADLSSNNVFSWIQKHRWANYPLQTFFALFALGMAGGYLPETGVAFGEWYYSVSKTAVPGEFLYLFASRVGDGKRDAGFLQPSSSICILLLVELNTSLQRILSSNFFRNLGKYSFGFYLLHLFVMAGPGIWIKQSLEGVGDGWDGMIIRGILTYAGMVVCMAPFCWLFLKSADKLGVWAGRYANTICERSWDFIKGWELWGRVGDFIRSKVPRFGESSYNRLY
jgi:peptidoglycan/LPS O-acetylase OafA/YrhL